MIFSQKKLDRVFGYGIMKLMKGIKRNETLTQQTKELRDELQTSVGAERLISLLGAGKKMRPSHLKPRRRLFCQLMAIKLLIDNGLLEDLELMVNNNAM